MRNLGLDLLRLTAIFLVLGRHMKLPDDANLGLRLWQRGGWVGVDLFFVLSGFLVSSLMFREHQRTGRVDVKRFLIRRGFKIYPAFWVLIAFTLFMKVTVYGSFPESQKLIGELLFLQNYLDNIWGYTWSLAVEEHFYLGIAALFACWTWLNPKHNFSAIPSVFLVVCLTCLAFRIMNLFVYPHYADQTHLFATHIRMDSLFFGVLISYLCIFQDFEQKVAWIPTWVFFGVGGLLLSPAFVFNLEEYSFMPLIGVMLFYVGSGLLLLGGMRLRESSFVPLKVLGVLGAASYSIYLWHGPIIIWGWPRLSRVTGWQGFGAYFMSYVFGACVFGYIMSRLVEVPSLKIRDFLFPSFASNSVKNAKGVSSSSVNSAEQTTKNDASDVATILPPAN